MNTVSITLVDHGSTPEGRTLKLPTSYVPTYWPHWIPISKKPKVIEPVTITMVSDVIKYLNRERGEMNEAVEDYEGNDIIDEIIDISKKYYPVGMGHRYKRPHWCEHYITRSSCSECSDFSSLSYISF